MQNLESNPVMMAGMHNFHNIPQMKTHLNSEICLKIQFSYVCNMKGESIGNVLILK